MPDVGQARLPGVPQDVFHHGGQVELPQLVDGEAPEGGIVGVHGARGVDVVPTVPVAPEVAQPHVEAGVGQNVALKGEDDISDALTEVVTTVMTGY